MVIEERFVEVDDLWIHVVEAGEGPPLLLLQGGVIDYPTLSWEHALEPLARHFRVVAPTLPGYGRSDRPRVSYTTGYYVRFVRRFLETAGLGPVRLVSLSMSGAVALGLTLGFPDLVERLVLVDAYGMQPRVPFHHLTYLLVRTPGFDRIARAGLRRSDLFVRLGFGPFVERLPQELVRDIRAAARVPDTGHAFLVWLRNELAWSGVRTNYTARLHEIRVPTLIVHGSEDWVMPLPFALEAARRIPGAELRIIPGSGHWTPRERPEEVNRALLEFLLRA